jgi:putative transposase
MKNVVRVRIYRTVEQKESLSKAFGCARWFWNNSLKATNELYKETGKGRSQIGMNSRLPSLKKEEEWLGETYSQVLQSVSLNLSGAFVNFFEGRTSYPNFKRKHDKQSIQYPQNVKLPEIMGLKPRPSLDGFSSFSLSIHSSMDGVRVLFFCLAILLSFLSLSESTGRLNLFFIDG